MKYLATRRKSSTMRIRIENAIWQFAKFYRKRFATNNPDVEPLTMSVAAVATFQALRHCGDAAEETDADGNVTWRVTPQFLQKTGGRVEPGPLVTFGPDVQ
jgi:hypothetical protein